VSGGAPEEEASASATAPPPAASAAAGSKPSLPRVHVLDVLLALAAIGLALTFLAPRWAEAERRSNEEAAIGHVRALGKAEKEFREKQPDKHFAGTFLELAAGGFDVGGQIEGGAVTRAGYVFRVGTLDGTGQRYYILAQPERFGETGARAFYIDDTGVLRGSPGPVVGPAFPEVR
jgi:hypothetical protein